MNVSDAVWDMCHVVILIASAACLGCPANHAMGGRNARAQRSAMLESTPRAAGTTAPREDWVLEPTPCAAGAALPRKNWVLEPICLVGLSRWNHFVS